MFASVPSGLKPKTGLGVWRVLSILQPVSPAKYGAHIYREAIGGQIPLLGVIRCSFVLEVCSGAGSAQCSFPLIFSCSKPYLNPQNEIYSTFFPCLADFIFIEKETVKKNRIFGPKNVVFA
jgi:hypothetical protein